MSGRPAGYSSERSGRAMPLGRGAVPQPAKRRAGHASGSIEQEVAPDLLEELLDDVVPAEVHLGVAAVEGVFLGALVGFERPDALLAHLRRECAGAPEQLYRAGRCDLLEVGRWAWVLHLLADQLDEDVRVAGLA